MVLPKISSRHYELSVCLFFNEVAMLCVSTYFNALFIQLITRPDFHTVPRYTDRILKIEGLNENQVFFKCHLI